MIPVTQQPEPVDFEKNVRRPGGRFLLKTPIPTTKQWESRAYWKRSIPSLYQTYKGICAYSAEWIPEGVGDPTVDHYFPKSTHPELAYEWSNYRLAALRFNSAKKDYLDVLDPFTLEPDWFTLNFPYPMIKPNPSISSTEAAMVTATVDRLKLNGGICIRSRQRWIHEFSNGRIPFGFLQENAPFIAYELRRQGLVDRIASMLTN